MKIILIAPKSKTFINFRLKLIEEILKKSHQVIAITPDDECDELFKQIGVKSIKCRVNKTSVSIFDNIKYLLSLYRVIKTEKPDVVFAYTIKPVIFGAIASRLNGVKNIYSLITGLGYVYIGDELKIRFLRMICGVLYKIACKFSKRVIFQNNDDRNEFVTRKYVSDHKTHVVGGSGVDMQHFAKTALPEGVVFLMVARVIRNKGVIEYFRACEIIKKSNPDIKCLFVGALDDTRDAIKYEEIKRYIDEQIIEYIPEVKDVRPYISRCNVYVLPSYREGVSRSTLEAMAMGRAIITTNAVGCKETVLDGSNGWLVDVQNSEQLAEKMLWMINNRPVIQNMGNESYNICQKRFDVNIVNQKMLELMEL